MANKEHTLEVHSILNTILTELKILNERVLNLEKKSEQKSDEILVTSEKLLIATNDIATSMNKVTTITESISNNTNKMSTHIDFVEAIYDKIKFPLNFIISKLPILITSNKLITDEK